MVTRNTRASEGRDARRYVVYGAGAIGSTIAARLQLAGCDVALVARGAHFAALAGAGLEYREPAGTRRIRLPVISHPSQLRWRHGDIVILAMKTQDTWPALFDLAIAAGPATPVICAQNGIENERLCARFFDHVYGLYVLVAAAHLEAGVVAAYCGPIPGILDIGRYPGGVDELAQDLAVDLAGASFSSRAVADIMRWKSAKLLANLANSIEAAWGTEICEGSLYRFARREGERCLTRAGIGFIPEAGEQRRRDGLMRAMTVQGHQIPGGSTWQTVARGHSRTEAEFLNGEIALLGRLYRIPTPVNSSLQVIVRDMAARGIQVGTVPMAVYEEMCRVAADGGDCDLRQQRTTCQRGAGDAVRRGHDFIPSLY
jgi:2-dehydropantoate 2-reductase